MQEPAPNGAGSERADKVATLCTSYEVLFFLEGYCEKNAVLTRASDFRHNKSPERELRVEAFDW